MKGARRESAVALARVRAVRLGVWGLVALGPILGVLALTLVLSGSASASPASVRPTLAQPVGAGAEGFAELFVATYLSEAGAERPGVLAPFYAGTAMLADVVPGGLYVAGTATLEATQISQDYWAVTVGARVLASVGGAYKPIGVRAYAVGVARTSSGYVATSLPAEVPLPARSRTPSLAVGGLSAPTPGPTSDTLVHFFSAFLAGDGEVDRYVSPGSGLRAVVPAPFVRVSVTGVGIARSADKTRPVEVRAEVEGVDADGHAQILQYALELAARAGRWEVRRLLPAAPLAHPLLVGGRGTPTSRPPLAAPPLSLPAADPPPTDLSPPTVPPTTDLSSPTTVSYP